MKDELEPCPMCGGDASAEGVVRYSPSYEAYWSDGTRITEAYFVNCCACQLRTHEYQTKAEAIAAWNRRATPAPMSEDALVLRASMALLKAQGIRAASANEIARAEDEVRAVLSTIRPAIEAAAREDERAKVVAWLHTGMVPDHSDDGGCPADKFADAIERGEHRENGDG